MKRRGLLIAAVPLSVLALVATGCGGSSGGGGGGGTKNNGTQPNAGVNGIRQASDVKGGTLNLLDSGDCDYWDPARTYYAHCWDLQRMFNRTLLAYKPTPGPGGSTLVPDIATGLGQTTDSKTWTYKLQSGLKFEDGTPITSKEVKYAIERVFATTVINGGPTYVITFLCPGGTKPDGSCPQYLGPYKDKAADHLGLSTIDTPDASTIVFHLNQPFSDWDYIMASPSSTPVPIAYDQSAKGGAKYTFHPISTGPYKIASYKVGKSLLFVRNTNWDPSTDKVRKALPDKITFTVDSNTVDLDNRILTGVGDVDVSSVGVQQATQAKVLRDASLKALSDNPFNGFTRYLTINVNVPPFNNIHCRKAVQYAVNKVDWQTARGGPIGGGDIATTVMNPNIQGFTKFDLYPDNGGKGDLAAAKNELTQCGKPNGFTTHLTTTNTGKGPKVAIAVQAALNRVGIKTVIDEGDPASYYSQFIGAPATNHKKDFGINVYGWGADFPTGYGFFSQIVDGRNIKAQGNSNTSELNDKTVDDLIDKATAAKSPADAAKIWGDVDKAVMASAAIVPMTYDKALMIVSKRLKNVYVLSAFGMYDFANLGVA